MQLPLAAFAVLAAITGAFVLVTSAVLVPRPGTLVLRLLLIPSCLLPIWLGWSMMQGRTLSRRHLGAAAASSRALGFLMHTLKLGAFHDWFVMNAPVARYLVEKSLAHETEVK